jgi:hypothetical protein
VIRMERCVFYTDRECTCNHPYEIVADAMVEIPSYELKTSIPVCLAHATQSDMIQGFVQRTVPNSKPIKVRIVPREPYSSVLKLLGVKSG